jgi:hypothetical protein
VDEAGFNPAKTRGCNRNIFRHHAIINVPWQDGGNITMCAAISKNSVLHHHAILGPYNTAHIITFDDTLHNRLIPNDQGPEQPRYVIIWDNVSFHQAAVVRDWFPRSPTFHCTQSPPYSPFLNPNEELFSAWHWKVHDCQPLPTPSTGNGGGLWRHQSGVLPGLDTALQVILSTLPSSRQHRMWYGVLWPDP